MPGDPIIIPTVNDITFNQLSTVLTEIVGQATGAEVLAPVTTADFVSVATTTLATLGYDPVLAAITQVLSRTIFSIRPYSRKFAGMQVSNQRYGSMTRKLQVVDKGFNDDDRILLVDGEAIDQFIVDKPTVLQTNWGGQNIYSKRMTIFRDQLDVAFNGPDEFAQFVSMTMTNIMDQLEQARESTARMILANYIAGKIDAKNGVVHLLSEYNALLGLSVEGATELTTETVYLPANFKPFMQWVYARVAQLSSLLTERTILHHINVTGSEIARHTPRAMQRLYLFAPTMYQATAQVLANTFNADLLKLAETESVNFWQSISTPDSINITPTYLGTDGALVTPIAAVEQAGVFGVLCDVEALAYTLVNQWSAPSPFNARGGYSNIFWHETARYFNDFTENGIILLLD